MVIAGLSMLEWRRVRALRGRLRVVCSASSRAENIVTCFLNIPSDTVMIGTSPSLGDTLERVGENLSIIGVITIEESLILLAAVT